jgi:hypothetical protein
MSALRGLVKIRKDGEPRLSTDSRARGRRTAADGRELCLDESTVVVRARCRAIATVAVRVGFGVNVGRDKCERGDVDDGELIDSVVGE